MRGLTDGERHEITEDLYAESAADLIGLWEVIKMIEDLVGEGEVREESLMIVNDLLARGLVVGDPPYGPDGYKAWEDQSPDTVVGRIRSEWMSLGRTPNIPDIAWFARPE